MHFFNITRWRGFLEIWLVILAKREEFLSHCECSNLYLDVKDLVC
jgi:hypothetical protein